MPARVTRDEPVGRHLLDRDGQEPAETIAVRGARELVSLDVGREEYDAAGLNEALGELERRFLIVGELVEDVRVEQVPLIGHKFESSAQTPGNRLETRLIREARAGGAEAPATACLSRKPALPGVFHGPLAMQKVEGRVFIRSQKPAGNDGF
jgi:hypothetical protein